MNSEVIRELWVYNENLLFKFKHILLISKSIRQKLHQVKYLRQKEYDTKDAYSKHVSE